MDGIRSVLRRRIWTVILLLLLVGCRKDSLPTPQVDLLKALPTYAPQQIESPSSGGLLLPLPPGQTPASPAVDIPWLTPAAGLADLPENLAGLRDLADGRGLRLGVSLDRQWLDDPHYLQVMVREFNLITPENALKFQFIHPEPDRYEFAVADAFIRFAEMNRMAVRGHTLVWDTQLPAWVWEADLTREGWRVMLREHITAVVSRYRGRIYAWDVVNEPLTDEGLLRNTLWLQKIGPEYIALALQWAHEADPEALLFVNDHAVEGINPKSNALYALARGLLQEEVPLHGVGFQAHLWLAGPPTKEEFAQNLKRFEDLGLQVHVTEMDVRTQYSPQPLEERLRGQAEMYGLIAGGCLAAPNCDTLVVWGLTDAQSWISGYTGNPDAPVLLDAAYRPKPAYETLRQLLEGE